MRPMSQCFLPVIGLPALCAHQIPSTFIHGNTIAASIYDVDLIVLVEEEADLLSDETDVVQLFTTSKVN